MKTKFLKTLIIFFTVLFCLFSCQEKKAVNEVAQNDNKADIEVIYFYGKQRCSTCMAIEKFAKEAIDSVFPEKVKDGVIEFKSVDITTADGEKLADLFEISSSSLFIISLLLLFKNLSERKYLELSNNCIEASKKDFNFEKQITSLNEFLLNL